MEEAFEKKDHDKLKKIKSILKMTEKEAAQLKKDEEILKEHAQQNTYMPLDDFCEDRAWARSLTAQAQGQEIVVNFLLMKNPAEEGLREA